MKSRAHEDGGLDGNKDLKTMIKWQTNEREAREVVVADAARVA